MESKTKKNTFLSRGRYISHNKYISLNILQCEFDEPSLSCYNHAIFQFFFHFYLYIYSSDLQESVGGAIPRASN